MKKSNTTQSTEPLEDFLTSVVHKGEAVLRPRWEQVEDQIRLSPTKAVLVAAGIGYFLHRLPATSLLGSTLKLAWAVAPPAIMAVLAGKGLSMLEEKLPASSYHPGSSTSSGRTAQPAVQELSL